MTEVDSPVGNVVTGLSGQRYQISPNVELTPNSRRLNLWIEGLDGSTRFAEDMISVEVTSTVRSLTWTDEAKYTVVETNAGVDGNRDNQISFDNSHDRQLTFWYNNDRETTNDGFEDDDAQSVGPADFHDGIIQQTRDLEDFASLNIHVGQTLLDYVGSESSTESSLDVKHRLYLESPTGALLNIYNSSERDGESRLRDQDVAALQSDDFHGSLYRNAINRTPFGHTDEVVVWNSLQRFIFETIGNAADDATLVFETTIVYPNAETTSTRHEIDLHLRDFTDFYTRYEIDYLVNGIDLRTSHGLPGGIDRDPISFATPNTALHDSLVRDTPFLGKPMDSDEDVVVFVHGWNMLDRFSSEDQKKTLAETTFKRLYWQGFRGHFVTFDWPTYADVEGPRGPDTISTLANQTYNASEFQAFRSGRALMETLDSLDGTIHLMAHSMGNIVTAEALRQWGGSEPLVATYSAMEAAQSAGMYGHDSTEAFNISFNGYTAPNVQQSSSNDLYRNWPDGAGSSDYYMAGTKSAASKWINYYNPDDVATNQAWRANNLNKSSNTLDDVILPELDLSQPITDASLAESLIRAGLHVGDNLTAGVSSTLAARLGPAAIAATAGYIVIPASLYEHRYIVTYDPQTQVPTYYRVWNTNDDSMLLPLGETPAEEFWVDITAEILNPTHPKQPGLSTYEILAFTSQSNAEAVGNIPLDAWFDETANIFDWIQESESVAPDHRSSHSFQFVHSAAQTWVFWDDVKDKTGFDSTY